MLTMIQEHPIIAAAVLATVVVIAVVYMKRRKKEGEYENVKPVPLPGSPSKAGGPWSGTGSGTGTGTGSGIAGTVGAPSIGFFDMTPINAPEFEVVPPDVPLKPGQKHEGGAVMPTPLQTAAANQDRMILYINGIGANLTTGLWDVSGERAERVRLELPNIGLRSLEEMEYPMDVLHLRAFTPWQPGWYQGGGDPGGIRGKMDGGLKARVKAERDARRARGEKIGLLRA